MPTELALPITIDLPRDVAAFLAEPGRFAVVATLDPDGAPRQAVAWYTVEADDRITLNSADGRRWPANLRRDGRVSITVIDGADGYRFVALTGVVDEIVGDLAIARADICAMARRYHADDPAGAEGLVEMFLGQPRVSFRVRITGIHEHLS